MQKQLKRKQHFKKKNDSSGSDLLEGKSGLQSSPTAEKTSGSSQSDAPMETKNDSMKASSPALTAEEFDRRFDEGESVFDLGFSKTGWTRPGLAPKRFNVDVPAHMLEKLDNAAQLRGVTRRLWSKHGSLIGWYRKTV